MRGCVAFLVQFALIYLLRGVSSLYTGLLILAWLGSCIDCGDGDWLVGGGRAHTETRVIQRERFGQERGSKRERERVRELGVHVLRHRHDMLWCVCTKCTM